jgi:hypothetical protein
MEVEEQPEHLLLLQQQCLELSDRPHQMLRYCRIRFSTAYGCHPTKPHR